MPVNPTRERFNAKARQSSAGSHKRKGKRASKVEGDDTNAEVVQPKSKTQKELEREERIKQELATHSESKMSSKKKRRLEKYIDKKLKKEERAVILQRLALSSPYLNMPVNPTRERFNAKARQSSAGSHKRKGKRASKVEGDDTNAEVVQPKSKTQKELEREERIKQELATHSESKMSSKKKRRLEKYIDKKLKKEERAVILQRLAASQAEMPTLKLQTSSMLGTGKVATNQYRLEKEEDKEVRRLMDGKAGKRKRHTETYVSSDESEGDERDSPALQAHKDVEIVDLTDHTDGARPGPTVVMDTAFGGEEPKSITTAKRSVGSALKKNSDGDIAAPIMKKKRAKGAIRSWTKTAAACKQQEKEHSDSSFDSSDSAYDSVDEAESDGSAEDGHSRRSQSESGTDDSDEHPGSSSDEEETGEPPAPKKRSFKDWAMAQLSAAKPYVAAPNADRHAEEPPSQSEHPDAPLSKRRKQEKSQTATDGLLRGPLGEDVSFPQTSLAKQLRPKSSADVGKEAPASSTGDKPASGKSFVAVSRPPDVQESRMQLPIVAEEQTIMEAIMLNPVVVICGETGSGKTTQVPQFLYEAGFGSPGSENPGMIGVTQPRRVAAVSMASRVARELSLPSSRVSYQIRYDASVSPSTSIKFMTDGVLLRELATDFLLTKYSVIIIDEAHERSMNTDILIGVLSRVIKLREQMWAEGKDDVKPLRLVIMSATLRVSDFVENKTLFSSPPPVINVAARQHPVTIHFSRRTSPDYVTEAVKKASKIHTRLPPGGILIFLTGQNEITGVCRKLEAKFGHNAIRGKQQKRKASSMQGYETEVPEGNKPERVRWQNVATVDLRIPLADVEPEDIELGAADDNAALDVDGDVDAEALNNDSDDESDGGVDASEGLPDTDSPMHIVPLYSLLPSHKQMRVFEPPPPGSRLVVVSTNVAETSLTIPGIRYVVDCGRAKERKYDVANGIQSFQISWISKASAAQRAGRAGRTGPGHCYRLYSSAVYENYFAQFAHPEILRMPIEGVVLQMKSMHIDAVTNFPFPTPPDRIALRKAESLLTHLGALSNSNTPATADGLNATAGGHITELGKAMALFPISPRFSRMLVSGRQHGCLPYVIAIVSALSVGDPFLHEDQIANDGSDVSPEQSPSEPEHSTKNISEVQTSHRRAFFKMQHTHAALGNFTSDIFKILSVVGAYEYAGGGHSFCMEHFVRPKAMEEIHKLRSQISNIVQVNFPETHAAFVPNLTPPSTLQIKVLRQLLCAAFIDQVAVRADLVAKDGSTGTKYASSVGVPYKALGVADDVFIHPSSILAEVSPPDYVVFHELVRTSRLFIKGVTVINPAWLSNLGKHSLCTFSKPMKNSKGVMKVIPRFGPAGWELPAVDAV
ncbi:P-loop containing nucleoside triphosphate hydrolase protein [Gloeophyllum trabeum ATCC 11539]|uniref:RNA helicase n=1 Tax=Gloeophyllum trabeum (strain ATCC 11539 / FP-39264 / Madison 617) TaxID=670483 RepID=S7RJI9_GLOTA|nr:P-loop containing nucleoside triphosphate hydrolase protein [Gloeophyllum trabeum ATCC 11539]EPQ54490.1 P-loop containing nucleoside triphosphate hydrolase protein [Gloeophyllum trabeum ATCC 11539]